MKKQALIEALILQSGSDALDYAMGAVMGQRLEKKPKAICYANKTLVEAQIN